jgi:L-amino acid N-acyltransferase YncA
MRFMPPISIRSAVPADAEAINAIYNHYVAHSTCTYQDDPETLERRIAWLSRHGPAHPVLVAERDGTVVGWGSLSPFHARSAYRLTVENTVYVHPESLHQGIGKGLMLELIAAARRVGHHCIVAVIDSRQPASIAMHLGLGFTESGRLREVGLKFGQSLDVVYLQKLL